MLAFLQGLLMFAWDDLRLVLAIARQGDLRKAASAMGVNHSTVFRRLNALEEALGSKLFERLASGYRATDSGQRLLEAAERMETEALALDRDLTGRDTRLTGTVRVTASETLAFGVLSGEIARFRAQHPGIQVELMVDNRMLDLSRREADVAFRAARPAEGDLFGRKIADVAWRFYAAPRYLAAHGTPRGLPDLDKHQIILWGEASQPTKAAAWLSKNLTAGESGYRTGSLVNQMLAAKAGMGLALLPTYLGGAEPALTAVLPLLTDLKTENWLVTHRSLKDTARVRAFMEIVGDGVKKRLAAAGRG
ncbi:MAG: LysR substrate-binding domain-containing protein [Pseudolabrys sp.]|nr:LysR substrate-binding domain-containing protein [Pseudolabrys sp.]